jgi:NTP pyrophosphatase (non-canonical NTP hydrolase)
MKVNLLNDGPVTIIIDSKIESKMDLKNSQLDVDNWIKNMVRYFNELTNMAQLTEEVGEVARIIARRYGEQSEKESDKIRTLAKN